MAPTSSHFPPVPTSHPILAHCHSELQASQIEARMREEGIPCIRIDREAASLHTGYPVAETAVILVSREDYARAKDALAVSGLSADSDSAAAIG